MSEVQVSLARVLPSERTLLANLMELYVHDLSALFPQVTLGEDGRFGYTQLPLYFDDTEPRFAFLIRADGRVAGFALATRGSPAADDPKVHDVAEFFVLRQYRRSRVGRRTAALLFRALPGSWTVRVLAQNARALAFWRETVHEFTQGTADESERHDANGVWRVFAFDASPDAFDASPDAFDASRDGAA
jgi:predicted acetyltransferase